MENNVTPIHASNPDRRIATVLRAMLGQSARVISGHGYTPGIVPADVLAHVLRSDSKVSGHFARVIREAVAERAAR